MGDADYSGTPLPKKLGIREGSKVVIWNPPSGFSAISPTVAPGERFDMAIAFCTDLGDLTAALARWPEAMETSGGLWLAWPKKSSGVPTELSDGVVRQAGIESGLVDNKVCAIDTVWSALRFVRRLRDR